MRLLHGVVNRKAFTALLVGAVLAVMIGAVLLIISYVVIGAISLAATGVGSPMNLTKDSLGGYNTTGILNQSWTSNMTNIIQALNVIGISLIVVGVAGIIYMLIGLGGAGAMGGRR